MSKKIRKIYEEQGVENYYSEHPEDYSNPHFEQVKHLLIKSENLIDYSKVLDLCCGNGEVSLVLKEMGYNDSTGCDPFTFRNYEKKLGKSCLRWGFDDILRGKLEGRFSSVICSFGLHLCEKKDLFMITKELFMHADTIVIITPHKRPKLEELGGIKLVYEDSVATDKGKKVRLKIYKNI